SLSAVFALKAASQPSTQTPCSEVSGRCNKAAGEVAPPSNPLTGPTAPERPVCAPGSLSSHCIADHLFLRGDCPGPPLAGFAACSPVSSAGHPKGRARARPRFLLWHGLPTLPQQRPALADVPAQVDGK